MALGYIGIGFDLLAILGIIGGLVLGYTGSIILSLVGIAFGVLLDNHSSCG